MGHYIQVTDSACQRLGCTREELLRMDVDTVPGGHDPETVRRMLERLRANQCCLFESGHLTRDGRLIPIEISARPIDYCGRRAVLAIARDITERKRAEAALKPSEHTFRRSIDLN